MFKPAALVILFLLFFVGHSQQVSLPADMRQHTLTQYNASLFNPAFSIDRNNPQSVAFWTRWQWQNIDADPTTLFLNYSRSLNDNSAAGLGFFQHNTGIYFNTGGALNYSYQIEFNRLIKLTVGANVFGFSQEIADTRFPVTTIPGLPQTTPTNDFILQVAPGLNLEVENFSLSLASENLVDYNFNDNGSNTATSDKIFMGMASYDFPVIASDSTAFIRPSVYLRTIPEQENQIGLNTLFSTKKYWVQSGYNNFYGISVGAGGTVFNRFSLGALVEFGINSSLNTKDPSFEVLFSYYLGKPEERRPLVASGVIDENTQEVLLADEIEQERLKEELLRAEQLANQNKEKESLEQKPVAVVSEEEENATPKEVLVQEETKADKKEAKRIAAELKALKKQKQKDSIAEVNREKEALTLLKKQEEEKAKIVSETARKEKELAEKRLEEEKQKEQQRLAELRKQNEAEAIIEAERIAQRRKLDSIEKVKNDAIRASELKAIEEQRLEAIKKVKEEELLVKTQELEQQRRLDSIQKADRAKASINENEEAEVSSFVEPYPGFKYQAMADKEDIEPGFYLVVNIFGTKKYFDLFMTELNNKGLQAKSFYRKTNQYNYVYLERYDSIDEARKARNNRFNNKYKEKISIFSVGK